MYRKTGFHHRSKAPTFLFACMRVCVSHRDLLVLLHAVEYDLDDLPAHLYALIIPVLCTGQVEESSTACHLDTLIIFMTLQSCYHQLEGGIEQFTL